MYNRELFQKVINYCGLTKCAPVTDEKIAEAQEQLGVRFPRDYINFIKEYGEGGIPGTCIFGIHENYYTVVKNTEQFREQFHIPREYIAVTKGSDKNRAWIICLDTSRMKDDLCPAVWFDRENFEITEYAESFDEVVDKEMLRLYKKRVKPNEKVSKIKKNLPDGMGYKSLWLLVKGSKQEKIVNSLLTKDKNIVDYKIGVKEVCNAHNKALVTADYADKNYVIMPLNQEYFKQDWVERKCKDFPECYAFLTERVTETHGFMKMVNGKVVRYYYQDEEGIIDIGKSMIEEQMNNIELPHDMKEYWENLKDRTKTILNEDIIMALALEVGGVEEYPYADVIVGQLID